MAPPHRRSFEEPTPHWYQLQLLNRAMKENTIVCLETGRGKTLIAVLLIRSFDHVIRHPSKSICIFLAPTVCLCEQQAEVIEKYTDFYVARFFGGVNISWDKNAWLDHVQNNEVFVMTPDILLKTLRHKILKPEAIELLIFDECHHAAKGHAYANIMTEFFHDPSAKCPRIFGMTASPINTKGQTSSGASKFKSEIQNLEGTLLSKICTVATNAPTPNLKVELYHLAHTENSAEILCQSKLDNIFQATTRLLLENKLEDELREVNRIHLSLKHCLIDLGLWCARKAAQRFLDSSKGGLCDNYLHHVIETIEQYGLNLNDYSADTSGISSKVALLLKVLDKYKNHENLRCIIFVERVITAQVLERLLNLIPFISCKYLASHQTRKMSRTGQKSTIKEFRLGEVNLLVATNVAEEGLDIQSCFLVIRFDLPKTERSNIQSRGRARQPGSDYVIFLKSGSLEEEKLLESLLVGENMMHEQINQAHSFAIKEMGYNEKGSYTVEATGAKVNVDSSVSLLHEYCSSLLSKGRPKYFKWRTGQGFSCKVRLPDSAEVVKVVGPVCETEDIAKRMACVEACKQLHLAGALNDHLLPFSRRSSTIEADSNEMELHETCIPDAMRAWHSFPSGPVSLYGHAILTTAKTGRMQYQSFAIFLSNCLENSTIELDLGRGETATAQLIPSRTIIFDDVKVQLAKCFHEKVFPALSWRSFAPESVNWHASRAYFLLPLHTDSTVSSLRIDWDTIRLIISPFPSSKEAESLVFANCSLSAKDAQGLLVTTEHTGTIYSIVGVLENLTSFSPFKVAGYASYSNYFLDRHNLTIMIPGQPLLEAKGVKRPDNWLLTRTSQAVASQSYELPPEVCTVVMRGISDKFLNTMTVLPSILHRLEALLAADQLRDRIIADNPQIQISRTTMLTALTPAGCNEMFSLERLEFLGDSILKLATSMYLYGAYPEKREGYLDRKRREQISNKNLHRLMKLKNMVVYIRERLDPKNFAVPGFFPRQPCFGHLQAETPKCDKGHRWLSVKNIADVAEAIIGGFLIDNDAAAAVKFMMWLQLDVTTDITVPVSTTVSKMDRLERRINYTFRNKAFLVEAFTHGSFDNNSYQRLEFLGDAILDYLVVLHLYATFPFLDPEMLSLLKSATVNNQWLAYRAVSYEFHSFLSHSSQALASEIRSFVSKYSDKSFEEWQVVISPKVLSDLMESLVAAIFLDTQGDLVQVWDVIKPLIEPIAAPDNLSLHPVCELQKLCQEQGYSHEYVQDSSSDNVVLNCHVQISEGDTLVGNGDGRNKPLAKRQAALDCLAKLKARDIEHPSQKLVEAIKSHPNPQTNKEIISKGMRLGATIRHENVPKPDNAPEDASYIFEVESIEPEESLNSGINQEDELESVDSDGSFASALNYEEVDDSSFFALETGTYSSNFDRDGSLTTRTDNSTHGTSNVTLLTGENGNLTTTDRQMLNESLTTRTDNSTHGAVNGTLLSRELQQLPPSSTKNAVESGQNTYAAGLPRSQLNMLCDKQKWPSPVFKCEDEQGPSHLKQFTYAVSIILSDSDRLDFPPGDPMPRVKEAQDSAAKVALEWLHTMLKPRS